MSDTYREELIQVAAVAVAAIQNYDTGNTAIDSISDPFDVLITAERERQEEKWGTRDQSPIEWLAILTEEVGEVARAVIEHEHDWNPSPATVATKVTPALPPWTTPRMLWASCCPMDPECDHSLLSNEELSEWMDHELTRDEIMDLI